MVRDLLKRRSFLPTEFHSKEFVKEYEKLEEKRVDSNDVDVNSLASAMSSLRVRLSHCSRVKNSSNIIGMMLFHTVCKLFECGV